MALPQIIAAIKTAYATAEVAIETRDSVKLNSVKVDMLGQLLELYTAALALVETNASQAAEKRDLDARIVELEKKLADREQYELHSLSEGVFVLSLKPGAASSEPHHYICQPCMDNLGKKQTLQRVLDGFIFKMECPGCRYKYATRQGPDFGNAPSNKVQHEYDPYSGT